MIKRRTNWNELYNRVKDVFEQINNTKLEPNDKERIIDFAKVLLDGEKYHHLKNEIEDRRKEIKTGEVLTHEEMWNGV